MAVVLSIVVPTKNRYYYLDFIVKYFLTIKSDRIELIIQDNSDSGTNKKLLEDLDAFNDHRIKYYFIDGHISQTDNCDRAISRATGEWITMIGDDDIFSKHLVEYCERWSILGYEAVLPNKASYIWPDVTPRLYQKAMSGTLRTQDYSGDVTVVDPADLPLKISMLGGTDILDLPRVYHGIVKKDILDRVHAHCGSYSPGPSPDIANAIALCRYLTSYVLVDLPLITSGQGVASAGGKGAQGHHYGEIAEVAQLPEGTAEIWNKKIPFYWSGKTIYAESVLKALAAMDMDYEVQKFDYNYLYAACLVFDGSRGYRGRILKAFRANNEANIFKVVGYFVKIWGLRINFHVKNNLKFLLPQGDFSDNEVVHVNDIRGVAEIIDRCVDRQEEI